MTYRKKLIEVALPLEAINREFAVPDSGKLLPKDFMFELNQAEFNNLRSQFDTSRFQYIIMNCIRFN